MIVTDLDGTVADTIGLIIASYQYALGTVLGRKASADECRDWIGMTLRDTFADRYPDHIEELMAAYLDFNSRNATEMIRPFPGISDLVSSLIAAGGVVVVATSKRRSSAQLSLDLVGLELPVTVAMEDTALHKPHPEPLLLALERLGVRADQAVYLGDAVVDIKAARAAGMAVIAVTWGAGREADLRDQEPDAVANDAAELAGELFL